MHILINSHTHTHAHTHTHTHTLTHTHSHTLTLYSKEEHLEVGAANFGYKTKQCLSFVIEQNMTVEFSPILTR